VTGEQMRAALLRVVAERVGSHTLQAASVLNEAARRLGRLTHEQEQALLTLWGDLFRTGYLAWGYDIANADPPFCHVTEQGRAALRTLSRDPANPDGYLQYLRSKASVNPVAASYLSEALATHNGGHHKAAAVMIGAAAEAVVLDMREALAAKLDELKQKHPADLGDWRIKRVSARCRSSWRRRPGRSQCHRSWRRRLRPTGRPSHSKYERCGTRRGTRRASTQSPMTVCTQDEGCSARTKEAEGGGRTWERCLANLSARQHRRPFALPRSAPGTGGPAGWGPRWDPPAAPAPISTTAPRAVPAVASPRSPPPPASRT
jgi:hypothetical protein